MSATGDFLTHEYDKEGDIVGVVSEDYKERLRQYTNELPYRNRLRDWMRARGLLQKQCDLSFDELLDKLDLKMKRLQYFAQKNNDYYMADPPYIDESKR